MAPRRYGKTGLVRNVFHSLPSEYATVYLDIYSTRNLEEFTQALANAVIGALDSAADKALAAIGKFFKSVRPTVTADGNGGATFSLAIDRGAEESTLNGVFDYIASKDRRVVVAIDEFQQILEYPETGTEALLRSRIQFMQNANFIFSGSRHHIMGEMFTSPRHPFYQSTDILSLGVISPDSYFAFAKGFFDAADRGISEDAFDSLYRQFDGVTWYVQSVLNRIWSEGGDFASERDVENAVDGIVDDRALTFHDLFQAQTEVGKSILLAIASERVVPEITAGAFLARHGLASASSVRSALPNLVNTDLVYRREDGYVVYDYFFAEYLRRMPSQKGFVP